MRRIALISFVLIPAAILLGACSLAEDITPPPGQAQLPIPTLPSTTPVVAETVYPIVPPDPLQGQAIYLDNCLPCHGAAGLGDGSMASKLPNPVPAIGTAALSRPIRPLDWFNVVTLGRMDRNMPPFRSLTDRQRWDVIAYVLSLSSTTQDLAAGQTVYAENCAACHGDTGRGDGPKAAGLPAKPADWTDPALLAGKSAQDLFAVTASGTPNGMPDFSKQLSDAQRWSVVSFIRSLGFASQGAPVAQTTAAGPTSTPTEAAAPGTATFTGKVVNSGSTSLPASLVVTLAGYDAMTAAFSQMTNLQADGTFVFQNVPVVANRVYMASLTDQNMVFNSDVVHAADVQSGGQVAMTIMVYETSTDTAPLFADRLHVIFDFSKAGTVNVAEIYLISNPTQKVIVPAAAGQPTLTFALPAGATNLTFPNAADPAMFKASGDGFGYYQPFPPGSGYQLVYMYDLPFSDRLNINLPLSIAVQAPVAMVSSPEVTLSSPQLQNSGTRAFQGANVDVYSGAPLRAGDTLKLTLISRSSISPLIYGAAGLGLVLALIGFFLWRRGRTQKVVQPALAVAGEVDQEQTEDELLDAIIALDDEFRAGELPAEAYQLRRAELKAKLLKLQQE